MDDSLKAALTTAALLYGCPRPGHSTPDSDILPVQLNIIKMIEISQFENRAHCKTRWEAHFYHQESAAKDGFVVLKGKEAGNIYLSIKGYFRLDRRSKIELMEYVEKIEKGWDNKNTRIETHHHAETTAIIRGLRP